MGSYVSLKPAKEAAERIFDYMDRLGIPELTSPEKYHVTLFTAPDENIEGFEESKEPIAVSCKRFEIFPSSDKKSGYLVLELFSPRLNQRHQEIVEKYGIEDQWGEYKPHMTLGGPYPIKKLSDVVEKVTCKDFVEFRKAIKSMTFELGDETHEEYQQEWENN